MKRCVRDEEVAIENPSMLFLQVVEAALKHLATRLVADCAQELIKAGGGKLVTEGLAWNAHTVSVVRSEGVSMRMLLVFC